MGKRYSQTNKKSCGNSSLKWDIFVKCVSLHSVGFSTTELCCLPVLKEFCNAVLNQFFTSGGQRHSARAPRILCVYHQIRLLDNYPHTHALSIIRMASVGICFGVCFSLTPSDNTSVILTAEYQGHSKRAVASSQVTLHK